MNITILLILFVCVCTHAWVCMCEYWVLYDMTYSQAKELSLVSLWYKNISSGFSQFYVFNICVACCFRKSSAELLINGFFSTWNVLFHWLLISVVSNEKQCINLSWFPCIRCVVFHFICSGVPLCLSTVEYTVSLNVFFWQVFNLCLFEYLHFLCFPFYLNQWYFWHVPSFSESLLTFLHSFSLMLIVWFPLILRLACSVFYLFRYVIGIL